MKLLGKRLKSNAAECLRCGDIIKSRHRHDHKSCSCGGISVDGGLGYLRRSARNLHDIKELSEYEEYYYENCDLLREDQEKVKWCLEMGFPTDGNWSDEQKTLYKLTWW